LFGGGEIRYSILLKKVELLACRLMMVICEPGWVAWGKKELATYPETNSH